MSAFVYAIGASESAPPYCSYLKIGRTVDPASRLVSLRIGSPIPLTYAALFRVVRAETAIYLETACHTYFRRQRVHGEWHNVVLDDLIKFVMSHAASHGFLVSVGLGGRIPSPPRNPTIAEIAKARKQAALATTPQ